MESDQPRILLIGYNYPPGGGIGSIRIAKFTKYLPRDWDIHVLTANTNTGPKIDAEVNNSESTTVHRVSELWENITKDFGKIRWTPPLIRSVQQLHHEYSFDAIWHTAGPFLPLTSVPILKRHLDIPYIVDFRDSWTLHPYKPDRTAFGRLYDGISDLVEPTVLGAADVITTATEGITEVYKQEYPAIRSKFITIENGYDPSDFPEMDVEVADKFTIVYVGKFSHFRDPKPFLEAISMLRRDHNLRFIHVGEPESSVQSAVSEFDLDEIFECTGYVDRTEVTRQIRRADLGLAVSGGSPQEMTTKIFDYMACKTPILACGPTDGSMANVVSKFQYGYTVPNQRDCIQPIINKVINTCPGSLGHGPYESYSREKSSKLLEQTIEDCIRS